MLGGGGRSTGSLCVHFAVSLTLLWRASDVCDTAAGGPAEAGVPPPRPTWRAPSTASQDTGCLTLQATAPVAELPAANPGSPQNQGHPRQAGVWGSGGEG